MRNPNGAFCLTTTTTFTLFYTLSKIVTDKKKYKDFFLLFPQSYYRIFMQKSARVTTPRTIQFQENVQIREIPRNDEEPQTQAAWDPNLRNVKWFFLYINYPI
jgi:hypothetical protein